MTYTETQAAAPLRQFAAELIDRGATLGQFPTYPGDPQHAGLLASVSERIAALDADETDWLIRYLASEASRHRNELRLTWRGSPAYRPISGGPS